MRRRMSAGSKNSTISAQKEVNGTSLIVTKHDPDLARLFDYLTRLPTKPLLVIGGRKHGVEVVHARNEARDGENGGGISSVTCEQ